jgi:hypothetical protein
MFIGPVLLLIVAPALRRIFLAHDRPPENGENDTTTGGETAAAEGTD